MCRLNGHSPWLVYCHKWIPEVWKPLLSENISIYPYAWGFFIVAFNSLEDRMIIEDSELWFWGSSRIFLKYPSFDPTTTIISTTLVWVRILNLPLHLWNVESLRAIWNTVSNILESKSDTQDYVKTTFTRIYVEMDFSKGFPTEIILTSENYCWVQIPDYDNLLFWCQAFYEMGHLAKNNPKSKN